MPSPNQYTLDNYFDEIQALPIGTVLITADGFKYTWSGDSIHHEEDDMDEDFCAGLTYLENSHHNHQFPITAHLPTYPTLT